MEGPQFVLTDQQLGNALDDIEEAFKAGAHPRDGVGSQRPLSEKRQSSCLATWHACAGPSPAISRCCNRAPPSRCAGDLDLDRILERLQQLLDCLLQEQLTPEQASHVMRISLGKFLQYLLKIRLNEPSTERVNNWFSSVMHTSIELLRTQDAWEMMDCTSRILTDSPNYNFYQLGVCGAPLPSGDIDSQSSGSGSDYDDPNLSPKVAHGRGGAGNPTPAPTCPYPYPYLYPCPHPYAHPYPIQRGAASSRRSRTTRCRPACCATWRGSIRWAASRPSSSGSTARPGSASAPCARCSDRSSRCAAHLRSQPGGPR